jgi:hypothetical protein
MNTGDILRFTGATPYDAATDTWLATRPSADGLERAVRP